MGVKLAAASGGSVELVPTNTASNYTATMPANTGTVVTTGSSAVVSQTMLETAVIPLGVGQTWQKPTRAAGTTYTNSTGRPITVALSYINTSTTGTTTAYIDGTIYISSYAYASSCSYVMTFVVPSGSTYQIAMTNASVYYWAELR